MVDYKKMYFELFNAITQSVEELSKAQLTTEEIYISSTCDREPYCGQGQEIRSRDKVKR